jgi:hypothetical protein
MIEPVEDRSELRYALDDGIVSWIAPFALAKARQRLIHASADPLPEEVVADAVDDAMDRDLRAGCSERAHEQRAIAHERVVGAVEGKAVGDLGGERVERREIVGLRREREPPLPIDPGAAGEEQDRDDADNDHARREDDVADRLADGVTRHRNAPSRPVAHGAASMLRICSSMGRRGCVKRR